MEGVLLIFYGSFDAPTGFEVIMVSNKTGFRLCQENCVEVSNIFEQ